MPTGYTAGVQDGKVTSFAEFAMNCARAFGALVELRDAPSAPIPQKFKPSSYHEKALADAQATLKDLHGMSDTAADVAASKEYRDAISGWDQTERENTQSRNRYNAMLAQVITWNPPSPDHVELKKFMVQQLTESLKFDCGDRNDWKPKRLNGSAWLEKKIASTERGVEYHTKGLADDIKRAEERTQWVQQLRDSLAKQHEPTTR